MQSFSYDLRRMTRWTPSKEVNTRTGEVAVTYSPVATYMMSFAPSYVQTNRMADGTVNTRRQRVIVNLSGINLIISNSWDAINEKFGTWINILHSYASPRSWGDILFTHPRCFSVGDRIGSSTEQMYEVMEVQTFRTNQQIIVEDVDAD